MLTAGERAMARTIFRDAIDYDRVLLRRDAWWPFQPRLVVMAPDGDIWFHPAGPHWCADFSTAPIAAQGLFMHEMTHVYHAARGGRWWLPLMRHPFCRYDYALRPGKPFHRYGIEQQAEIVRHTFLLRAGFTVPGAPALESYETLLGAFRA